MPAKSAFSFAEIFDKGSENAINHARVAPQRHIEYFDIANVLDHLSD